MDYRSLDDREREFAMKMRIDLIYCNAAIRQHRESAFWTNLFHTTDVAKITDLRLKLMLRWSDLALEEMKDCSYIQRLEELEEFNENLCGLIEDVEEGWDHHFNFMTGFNPDRWIETSN